MTSDPAAAGPYRRIRALWPDHLGLARGKILDAGVLESAEPGTGHALALFALGLHRDMTPYDGSGVLDGLPDMRAVFDPAAVRPGWPPARDTGVVVADLETGGAPLARSPRQILKNAVARFTADDRNPLNPPSNPRLNPVVGIELEAFLLRPVPAPDDPAAPPSLSYRPLPTPGHQVYGAGPLTDPAGVLDRVLEAADAAGIVVESFHGEYDNGQFEFTFRKKDALAAADEAFLFRLLAREVAAAAGFHLTFLGKPFTDRGGSGLHVNLSLEDAADPGTASGAAAAEPSPPRRNRFDDPEGPGGLSALAWQALAGLLRHHRALAAVLAPTVNAYRRLRPAQMSGYYANWGHDHRGCAVRIPPERGPAARLEHRLADGACGPHIAVAAVLAAARLGIERGEEPPPEETADCLATPSRAEPAPEDLGAALRALEADAELSAALGEDFVRMHCAVKRDEWERYRAHTSDWELREYLPNF